MRIQRLGLAHGWHWLIGGFALFRRSPLMWIVFVAILYLAARIALQLPLVGILLMLVYPVFLAGMMIGCRDLEQGKTLEIGHLLAGLRHRPGPLIRIGAVNLAGQMLIGAMMYAMGGAELRGILAGQADELDPAAVQQAANQIMFALSVGTVLSIPLLMAVWFAPLLAVFRDQSALQAMKHSFIACWHNLIAFFSYGLLLVGLVLLATLPFGLINAQQSPGAWIVLLFVLPSIYVSYRDLFRDFA